MHKLLMPAVAMMLAVIHPTFAQSLPPGWQAYVDPTYGFSAEIPASQFAPVENASQPGLALREIGGEAQISLYGGPATGMTRDALEQRLEAGEQIRTITYRAGGDSWFVLSGFYESDGLAEQEVFYTKVLFSPRQDTFSAFEISFPASQKPRFEAMVEYFEDNFTRPTL